ncbi:MAG: NAD+ synthase [Candidatus Xiphinematobacter sp.]|nr:MAG: NAD+ synthase [Candidatus Xiphinematobacter sp.]
MKIGIAQLNTTIGDFPGNADKILSAYRVLSNRGAEVVLTPELALCGYPPLDLLFRRGFVQANIEALRRLQPQIDGAALIVGYVDYHRGIFGKPFHNAAAILTPGRPPQVVHKSLLPTYDVFDEARYFEPSKEIRPVQFPDQLVGVTVCEDIWVTGYQRDPVKELVLAGAKSILNLSASPFQVGKVEERLYMLREVAIRHRVPIFYCNSVGGNDQLVFDGHSLVVSPSGGWRQLPGFQEHLELIEEVSTRETTDKAPRKERDLFRALVLGVHDYVEKCGFQRCVLGLSGGIDSAVTAVIAVSAVGKENVLGIAMPGPYSSRASIADALHLAQNLGICCLQVPIISAFESLCHQLTPALEGFPTGVTEENLQARLRGVTLMAFANKTGSIVLNTGNKSELAVGYCTLYGDMCGGLAVLSDVPKTAVYHLAKYINRDGMLIPGNIIKRPASAELHFHQIDQDSLPPYEILDSVLHLYIERNWALEDIIQQGFDAETVRWIVHKVDTSEHKRQQAAPGIRVSRQAFGIGRRVPIAQKFYLC